MSKSTEETSEKKLNPKPDMSIMHSVSEQAKKFGDIKGKREVKIPELQMSFFVDPSTPEDVILMKTESYKRRGGVYLFMKDRDE